MSKKRPPAALEQSSLYEDVVEASLPKIDDLMARVAEKRRKGQEEEENGSLKKRESSDKENSQSSENSEESPQKKAKSVKASSDSKTKSAVMGKTYGKKGLTSKGVREEENEEEEEGMTIKKKVFGQNTISRKPPAGTKQV